MSDKGITDEEYQKGGYAKHNLTKQVIDEIHSRVTGSDGKVYRGEAGQSLKKKMLEKQAYYERNRSS